MKNILKRIISKYENVVMNDKRILRIIHTLDPTLGGPSNVIIDNSLLNLIVSARNHYDMCVVYIFCKILKLINLSKT